MSQYFRLGKNTKERYAVLIKSQINSERSGGWSGRHLTNGENNVNEETLERPDKQPSDQNKKSQNQKD